MTDTELLRAIYDDTQELNQRVTNIESNVTNMQLTLENEIRTNIQLIAEGHLDLSRNLHDAMKPSNEVEMLGIKVNMLETDVRALEQKMA